MPTGSNIIIRVNGVNIVSDILPDTIRFESQLNATPGTFTFTVKDTEHTHSFITGKLVELVVDGYLLYGGFLLQVERTYPFPAMDTTNTAPADTARYWKLSGSDWNRLFDKRVLHDPAAHITQIPNFSGAAYDGDLIQEACADYLDLDGLVDYTTHVDNIQPPFQFTPDATKTYVWPQQGSPWRKLMEEFSSFNGAVWYLGPKDATHAYLYYTAIEDSVHRWGFSDNPNYLPVTASPASFQGTTIGPREIDATEDGSHMVNDALIWGGSAIANNTGAVVFGRETNSSSISTHGRWQLAETHIGEEGYKLQEGVDVRADVIVNGSPGAVGADQNRGLRFPQWSFRFQWFAHQVPTISGTPDHLYPGQLTTIELQTFGPEGTPLVQLLPLRQMTISCPSLDPDGQGYVKFDGYFGLQPSDPFTLWRFIRSQRRTTTAALRIVDNDSTSSSYGAIGSFTPSPTPNGSATVFTIPFGYILGTTQVYLKNPGMTGGLLLLPNADYVESDPVEGEVTLSLAPVTGAQLLVQCRTL